MQRNSVVGKNVIYQRNIVAKVATKLEFLVAKLKVVLALATVSVAISSPAETLSQSTVFGIDIGSTACTIIAVRGGQKFLRGEVQIPSEQNINECVGKFACTMREGNLTY